MLNLKTSTAAFALMFGLAACSDGQTDTRAQNVEANMQAQEADAENPTYMADLQNNPVAAEPVEAKFQKDRLENKTDEMNKPYFQMLTTEFEMSEMIGEDIHGENGEEIASVSDLIIGDDGRIESIVFANGGIAGLGTKYGKLNYDEATVTLDEENEPRVRMSMTSDALAAISSWEQDKANDYRLASELMGTNAQYAASDEKARITDLVANLNGEVRYALVSASPLEALTDERYVVDFDKVKIAQGDSDGELQLDLTKEMIQASMLYREIDD
ncbi:PRC-barrel domain-containing protein [Hirschia litorea]|uniref:PRC-barrel domain-containing protein n=1 Tax=Hirschia litorea TaxID=1199156 RepID=A0ABW2INC5_9PROT